jgi:hypothetical protein
MDNGTSVQGTAAKGVAVLVAFAAVGALVVNKGFHGDKGTAAVTAPAGNGTNSAATTTVPGATTVPGDSTPPASNSVAVPSGSTKVVVANGTSGTGVKGVAGSAARLGGQLTAKGFTVIKTTNATSKTAVQTTVVYFTAGNEAQAQSVAQAVASPTIKPATAAMPNPLPIAAADVGEAQIIVLLGRDLASA